MSYTKLGTANPI